MQEDIILELDNQTIETADTVSRLTDKQRAYVQEFSAQINLLNAKQILQYGMNAQQKSSVFTANSIWNIADTDIAEMNQDIEELIKALKAFRKSFDAQDITDASKDSVNQFKALYDKASSAMMKTSRRLEIHRSSFLRHHKRLEDLYEKNMLIIQEYDMYIYAGRLAVQEFENTRIPALHKEIQNTHYQEDILLLEDYTAALSRMNTRLNSLTVSRQLPLQTASQIRMIQNTDEIMAENLSRINTDSFSLWRTQTVLSLGLQDTDTDTARFINAQGVRQANDALLKTLENLLKIYRKYAGERKVSLLQK